MHLFVLHTPLRTRDSDSESSSVTERNQSILDSGSIHEQLEHTCCLSGHSACGQGMLKAPPLRACSSDLWLDNAPITHLTLQRQPVESQAVCGHRGIRPAGPRVGARFWCDELSMQCCTQHGQFAAAVNRKMINKISPADKVLNMSYTA